MSSIFAAMFSSTAQGHDQYLPFTMASDAQSSIRAARDPQSV